MAILPLVNREIPIVADYYVDKEFGTGAVKITPAHDPNDFEVGKRHNLPEINIMNDDATINEKGGKYAGMDRYEARKAIVADLDEQGYLVKVVPHMHAVGTHDRCGTTVEPLIKQQWFVKMDELAKPAINALKTGELRFVPERFDKIYLHWLENIKDWCISRQIWWGHRIPAYYCDECGEFVVAREMPEKCPHCGCTHFTQDEDTLDTWFSSALWPFSTLGWPDKTEDLDYFYPTDVLVTGYDIIFFWVIRMVFSGYAHTGKAPFNTVLIHGLVRDSQGRKMSKSLGNGIDPLEIIDQYGADALRLTLITGNAPGNDMRFYNERVEASRNFANKVWNASRFILMNMKENVVEKPEDALLTPADRWILSAVNTLAKDVTENMDKFELGIAVQKVYDFIWDEFCDWYVELAKYRIWHAEEDQAAANCVLWVLKTVLGQALKLLHPFMPFITEEIYLALVPEEESLMMSSWPVYKEEWNFPADENVMEHIKAITKGIRNVRAEMDVPNSRKTKVYVVCQDEALCNGIEGMTESVKPLMNANEIIIEQTKEGVADNAVSVVVPDAVVYLPLEDLVDFEQELERLKKEEDRLNKEIKRAEGMLANERFVSKAPADKVQAERDKLEKYTEMLAQVKERRSDVRSCMKKIHIRKPDIKGLSVKVRNLKFKDIKEHYKARKERRQKILEERRNSKFAKKMQPVYKWMNRLSLPLQYLLACVINFFIEVISRHSLFQAWNYMTGTPLVFLFNAFLIFATFMIVYLFKRRVFVRILLSVFWLFLGTCNGYLLLKRVTPFNAQDLKVLSDALELTSNYFNAFEIVMLSVGIVAVILWIISMWRRGGQYTGKMHRLLAVAGIAAGIMGYMGLTNVAIENRVISNYFGNIAFAYEDYGL